MARILLFVLLIVFMVSFYLAKKSIENKFMYYLSCGDFNSFFSSVNKKINKYLFSPYKIELIKLNGFMFKKDNKQISNQLDLMLNKMRLTSEHRAIIAEHGFYFYFENEQFDECKKMIEIINKSKSSIKDAVNMNIIYEIFVENSHAYIETLKGYIEKQNNKNTEQIGLYELLISKQYKNMNDDKNKNKYKELAIKHCKNSKYLNYIKKYL